LIDLFSGVSWEANVLLFAADSVFASLNFCSQFASFSCCEKLFHLCGIFILITMCKMLITLSQEVFVLTRVLNCS